MVHFSIRSIGQLLSCFPKAHLLTRLLTSAVLFSILSALSGSATASNILAVVSVANLPTTITLCRDPTAYAAQGVDEYWEMFIDIDNDAATGTGGGYDALIEVFTDTSMSAPCSPKTTDTQIALQANLFVWDASQGFFVDSGIAPTLTLDFVRSTMTITVPADGPLAGISAKSTVHVQALAPYTSPDVKVINLAGDAAINFKYGNLVTDAAGDVQQCSTPCSTSAPYYPLIDLISTSLGEVIFRSSFE